MSYVIIVCRLFTKQRSAIEKEYGQVHVCMHFTTCLLYTFEGIAKTVSAVSFKKEVWSTT